MYHYVNPQSLTRSWHIGPYLCSSRASLAAFDTAHYPEDVNSVWHEYPGLQPNDDWQPTAGLKINCFEEFQGMKMHIKIQAVHVF